MRIHDVLVVGAGPCGLAMAARLREPTPSATFTDDEHQRYHWIRKHGKKVNTKNHKTHKDSLPTPPTTPESSDCGCTAYTSNREDDLDMLVLDADGTKWMSKWDRLFDTFGIDTLRSPMFFHVDPADRDALLGYTYELSRESELIPLPGCVGKEVSKHHKKKKRYTGRKVSQSGPDIGERDRKDYHTPSTALFAAHCRAVARRYGLARDMIRHEKVINIEYRDLSTLVSHEEDSITVDDDHGSNRRVFQIVTDKTVHFADIVILAVGAGNVPSIPHIPRLPRVASHLGFSHAFQVQEFPARHVSEKIRNNGWTNMIIVGGGLTSIQLADLAIKRGVHKVYLLMRGPLKVKYFDIDLDWVGKFRNINQAIFWSADSDEDRLRMNLEARNGGSITPRYRKILDAHVASGRISLHTCTTLSSADWSAISQTWTCSSSSPELDFPPIDYIVFATGVKSDISSLPFLQALHQQHPVPILGGLPCLNDDLMWRDDIPLFVTGRFAGLKLGPGAPNLVGARVGAERIAWNVRDLLIKKRREKVGFLDAREEGEDTLVGLGSGRGNWYASLAGKSE